LFVEGFLVVADKGCRGGGINVERPQPRSDVIVTETNVDTPVTLHTAPVGTPLPTDLADLDPQQWSTVPRFLADNFGTDDQ
jgi:hypothetical protein